MSFTSILWWQQSWNRERNSVFENSQLKIRRGRRSELVVSCQVVINQFCGLPVIFCGFLIGRETINIPEIFSGVHGFSGKTVIHSEVMLRWVVDLPYTASAVACNSSFALLRRFLQYVTSLTEPHNLQQLYHDGRGFSGFCRIRASYRSSGLYR